MRTVNEIVDAAFGRVADVTATYPSARGPMFVRVGMRQRHLYQHASKLDPDRYGTSAIAALATDGAGRRVIDLSDIVSPVPLPEVIQNVTVSDAGTSSYPVGETVTIVTPDDLLAELPPRALLRNRVLIGVSTDLDLVTSVEFWYALLPDPIRATDKDEDVALDEGWDVLLELDLAKWLLTKATQIAKATRDDAMASLVAEETALLKEWDAHIVEYAPSVSRFTRPRVLGRES